MNHVCGAGPRPADRSATERERFLILRHDSMECFPILEARP
jgi:hypothetical protein